MPHLDFTQPPFDVLSLAERQSIRKHTQIRYLAKGESLPVEELTYLYVVIKGQIEQSLDGEFVASYLGSNHADDYNNNDWFDSRRLPESVVTPRLQDGKASNATIEAAQTYQYRASEDTLLLQVTGEAIDKISAQNHLVRQLLSDKLPERLKALQQRRQNKTFALSHNNNQQEVQQIMLQPVTDVTLLPVHIVEAHSSLFEAFPHHDNSRTQTRIGATHQAFKS